MNSRKKIVNCDLNMKEFDPHNQVEFYKPPVPKARPPLRNFNAFERNDSVLLKENIYKIVQQNQEFVNTSINETSFNSDDSDADISDDNITNNEFLSDLSHNLMSDSTFVSARTSPITPQLLKRNFRNSNTTHSFNDSNASFSYKQSQNLPKRKQSKKYKNLFLYSLIVIVFLVITFFVKTIFDEERNHEISDNRNFKRFRIAEKKETEKTDIKKLDLVYVDKILDTSMQIIKTRFYNQKPNVWNDISSGMYDVASYPEKPSVIILFGNETDTLNCLAHLLGQLGGTILGSNDYLTLTPKDFPNDVGETIYNLQVQILQKRAVIIQDLLSINTEAIKAFHNFCDRENPLIRYAVYILTIIIDEFKPLQREIEFVERLMIQKLSNKIDKDILSPLVTRLTDGIIIPVFPESGINHDHKNCSFSTR